MGAITEAIGQIRASLPDGVALVAVSKFHPVAALREAYDAGQRIFGESRAQELAVKVPAMPDDVEWHFIGHLQTNKVRMVLPFVRMIHSVDSERLLLEIEKEAARLGKTVDVLLELHVAREESKYGFSAADCGRLSSDGVLGRISHVRVCGVMAMATDTDDTDEIRGEFRRAADTFRSLRSGAMSGNPYFRTISMGMSHDYRIAVEEGSTMVRIGSRIFGERQY